MSKRGSIWGNYYPVDSLVHRLDPRCKLTVSLIFLTTVFFADNFLMFAVMYAFAALSVFLCKIPVKMILRSLRVIIFLSVLTGVLNGCFISGEKLFQLGPLVFSEEGLLKGGLMILRLILLIGFSSLLMFTTTAVQLTDGLEDMFKPLAKLRVPTHELAMMISIALRFIPILMREVDSITKAQRARGVDFRNVKNVIALIIPLFASSLQRASDLAVAMEARGYSGGEGRTKYHQLTWCLRDTLTIIITVVFSAAIIVWRFI